MKRSNRRKNREDTAFLYERLSRDDNLKGESYSIGNQKKLLIKVTKEKGYTNFVHFSDDGISGVTMERPGFVTNLTCANTLASALRSWNPPALPTRKKYCSISPPLCAGKRMRM